MMKKYTEEELKQVFENRSNCYADSDEVIMAMDKDRFIEVLKELKILPIQRVSNNEALAMSEGVAVCVDCLKPVEIPIQCKKCEDAEFIGM
jgi:hypothetical protein